MADLSLRISPAFGASLGLLFTVPFLLYYRPTPIGDFHTEWLAVVLLGITVASGIAALPRQFHCRSGLLAFPIVLSLIILIQVAVGRYVYSYDWAMWLGYLAVFSLALILGQGVQSAGLLVEVVTRIAWAIVLTSLVLLFTQLAQVLRMDSTLHPFVVRLMDQSTCRIHGNIGQANQATTMAWFGIAAAAYLVETRRLSRLLGLIVIALLLLSSALTASRMAWLFCGLVGASMLWPLFSRNLPIRRRLPWVFALLIGFATADVLALHLIRLLNPACLSGLERIADESGSFSIRWNLWRQALLVWGTHPWIGSGAGSFIGQVFVLDHAAGHQPLDGYAHNSLLQLLAELGALGAAAAAVFLAGGAWSVIKRRRDMDEHRLLLLVWVAILLTYSMLEFPLWYMHFLILFGLSIGLLTAPAEERKGILIKARVTLSAAVLALLSASAFVAYDYKKAERAFNLITDAQALHVIGSPQLSSALEEISSETRLYRMHVDYAVATSMQITKENLQAKIEFNGRLVKRVPLPPAVARQILLLTLAGDVQGARWYLHRMLKFSLPMTAEAIEEMRRIIKQQPQSFALLESVLTDELAASGKIHG